ncbi:PrsW family intramembrane metalloprotease [Haloplasma contractile]|uniref:Protease PrsW n=1 Tax=Haloplasma contractile SSD-17B TaxID=1033810 RepID=U2FRL5_9MOLU|nr:PrsW family glutamic-type intramembrane protease [Haloplasma contractile]ERJ13604.1 YpdC protein [Haloplasma contractile SSD-17B]
MIDRFSLDLVAVAVIPVITILLIFYYIDRHEKEPIGLLLKLFLFGMLISGPILFLEIMLDYFNRFTGVVSYFYTAFIVAGFSEEFFKRSVVIKLAFNNKHFNERFDGIIYSVFVSLGFALVENVLYVIFGYQSYQVGISRAFLSVPSHMLFAVTMGYYLSLSKYSTNERKKMNYYRQSLIAPILLHGAFNFIIAIQAFVFMPIFLIFLVYLWYINILRINKLKHVKEEE